MVSERRKGTSRGPTLDSVEMEEADNRKHLERDIQKKVKDD